MRPSPIIRLGGVLLSLALVGAACSDDDDVTATGGPTTTTTTAADDAVGGDGDSAFPVTVTVDGVDTVLDEAPTAIVSMSPTATEMLFAIGAGDQVIAVDDYSYFPAEAPTTDLSAFDPNIEAIAAYEPDLVVLSGDRNEVVAGLGALDIPTIVVPSAATIDDAYTQIEALGVATGHVGDAAELVLQMQSDIDELVAGLPERATPLTYYHELDDTLFSVTSSTFIGEVYSLAGLDNVADAADPDGESGGYPQLSPEFLVDADPDLIFLADTECCAQDATTVAARPGFGDLRAVVDGNIIELPEDIASRWGPRIVDFLAVIVEATANVDAPVGAN